MTEIAAMTAPSPPRVTPVASRRHTIFFLIIVFGITFAGMLFRGARAGAPPAHASATPLYLTLLLFEWGLFYFVARGVLHAGVPLRDVAGGRWSSANDIARDVALAAALWIGSGLLLRLVDFVAPPSEAAKIVAPLLPHTTVELALWIVLSISAGIVEEFVFRGYLQRQIEAFTGSVIGALLVQALVFGIGHGYQGLWASARITLYGLIYGVFAHWRRSTRPGMIAHGWTDVISGIVLARS